MSAQLENDKADEGRMAAADSAVERSPSNVVVEDCVALKPSGVPLASRKEHIFAFTLFVVLGCVQLIGWNAMLFALPNLRLGVPYMKTVTAAYSTVVAVLTAAFIMVNVVKLQTLHFGLGMSALTGLFLGISAHVTSSTAASWVFHVIGILMGVISACVGSSGFGYAGRMPRNYSGAASAGHGVAGILSFAVWMISAYLVFKPNDAGLKGAVWVISALIILFSVAAIALTVALFRRPWVRDAVTEKTQKKNQDDEELQQQDGKTEAVGTYETGGVKLILQTTWYMAFFSFLNFVITLFCFPTLGPLSFNIGSTQKDILTGIFQVGDLIGRYAPNVVPALMVRRKPACIIISSRLILVAAFLFSAKLQGMPVFNDYWFMIIEMFLLSITNGWLATVCFVRISEMVEGDEAKERVGSITLLSITVGISVGLWAAGAVA